MTSEAIKRNSTLNEVEERAALLWRGHYGYDCPNCGVSVYGKSVEWCLAHLLEHLVRLIRGTQEKKEPV